VNSEEIPLNKVIQHIRNVCCDNLVSVTLYGSKARGDSTYESDIDLLILVNNRDEVDRDKLYDFLLSDDIGYDLNFSLNLYEKRYFNYLATIHAPFVENVLKEGVTLWAREKSKSNLIDALKLL
jgi:predicted nucleotidyltransferase